MTSIINETSKYVDDYERLIFLPFPLGVGNDLSIMLNFGGNMDLYYMYKFFDKLNSENTREYLVDSWNVVFNYPDKKKEYLNHQNHIMKKMIVKTKVIVMNVKNEMDVECIE